MGSLRLRPPKPITEPMGKLQVTRDTIKCPQFEYDVARRNKEAIVGQQMNSLAYQRAQNESEDCLYLNIFRPKGTKLGDKLPILFWIFGGGFSSGDTPSYDSAGAQWVSASVAQGQPIIFVTISYRLAGFGFLAGKEIKEDGASNIGLLDQRLGLEWISDNIESFGGDPEGVTIWGQSAGAESVFDHTILYDGNITYNGKQLFRGAIMNSGNIVPAHDVEHPKAQDIYNRVVDAGGCSEASDTLECLRGLDYETFLNATTSVPDYNSYTSIALSYLPRPDGNLLTASPEVLTRSKKYAQVPLIIGDQEDEGTTFSIYQSNITTEQELADYLHKYYFPDLTPDLQQELISLYADDRENGSPFRTGNANRWYPQFKRLAAILGDEVFTLARRITLRTIEQLSPDLPTWSYLASYNEGTPKLGTSHSSDIQQVVHGMKPNYAAESFKQYYISFVNHLDPNKGVSKPSKFIYWPRYSQGHQLLQSFKGYSKLVVDDFRSKQYEFFNKTCAAFQI